MKTLVALYEMVSHAKQAATLLTEELGLDEGRVQLASQGVAARADKLFDDVPGLMEEEESMALGPGGGGMVAVRVDDAQKEAAAREILTQFGLIDLVAYEGELNLEAEAEPTWLEHESSFLRHFEANYLPKGQPFDVYAPAYRFGHELALAGDEEKWDDVSALARRGWEAEQEGSWQQFGNAVRFAWEEVVNEPETLEEALGDEPLQTTKRGRLYQELHDEDGS